MTTSKPDAPGATVAIGEFVRNPSMVGSAFPASKRMVRRMLAPLQWAAIDVMVEYGPGTGRFTFAALARMKPEARLIAIETGEEFAAHLRAASQDPRLSVVEGSATDVVAILANHGVATADCILSGLPFSTLEPEDAERIVFASRSALAAGGILAAYQMRRAVEPLLRRAFADLRRGFELWNMPPCHLYWARRAAEGKHERRGDFGEGML